MVCCSGTLDELLRLPSICGIRSLDVGLAGGPQAIPSSSANRCSTGGNLKLVLKATPEAAVDEVAHCTFTVQEGVSPGDTGGPSVSGRRRPIEVSVTVQ